MVFDASELVRVAGPSGSFMEKVAFISPLTKKLPGFRGLASATTVEEVLTVPEGLITMVPPIFPGKNLPKLSWDVSVAVRGIMTEADTWELA
jgi:hypothetical protein